jgi:hypothetical protein
MAPLRELYRRLRYEWRLHYLLPVLLFFPLIVLVSRDPFLTHTESGEPVTAEITRLGVGWSRYQGRTPGLEVAAKTADGAMGFTLALPADVAGCEVGDSIRAEQKGFKLYLKPAPCAHDRDRGVGRTS